MNVKEARMNVAELCGYGDLDDSTTKWGVCKTKGKLHFPNKRCKINL